jgi:cell wall-associated NlpC family hydrolase
MAILLSQRLRPVPYKHWNIVNSEKELEELTNPDGYEIAWHDHEVPSHRSRSSNTRLSIVVNSLVIVLIGLAGIVLVESGILARPSRAEALDVPLIPNIASTFTLPTDNPPTVDSPHATDEHTTRALQRKPIPKTQTTVAVSKVERMLSTALAQQGDRYRWGATGPNAFDCSGLVVYSFRSIGMSLPHFTGDLLKHGTRVNRASLKRGDLIFPTSSHVGIYLGGNKMVVASSGKGRVIIQTVYSFYAGRRLL